ncbi:hypothetical protein [Achromobacter dolens]|nr:hypothetical protein [Achromobacter dolens]
MSEVKKDPFDERSWGALRYKDGSHRIVERALATMNSLGIMFGQDEGASPKLVFVPGGELPVLGRFNTPLGSAEVRLQWRFEASAHQVYDSLLGTIVVFVEDPMDPERRLRQVDWRVEVSQYEGITATSGGHERTLAGPQAGHYTDMNFYQSGMALYRAIVEAK